MKSAKPLFRDKMSNNLDIVESILSIVVFGGMLLFVASSLYAFVFYDWSNLSTFYEFVNYILAIVVGIELSRLLITHDIYSISNLLTFVVARKLLSPDLTALDLFLGILAFGILFIMNLLGNKYKQYVHVTDN